MKKRFLNYIKKAIKNQYPSYSNDKLDEIMYGVEGIYLTFTKTIIIFGIAIILGIVKELILLLLAFNFIRLFAFGIHADKSSTCLIFSTSLFIGFAYLCKYAILNTNLLITLYIIAFIFICLFAPSDTVKRPLIRKDKRIRFKNLSIVVTILFFITTLFIKNNLIVNSLIFGLLIECILICPLTYKIFNMPYNNYKTYDLNTKK